MKKSSGLLKVCKMVLGVLFVAGVLAWGIPVLAQYPADTTPTQISTVPSVSMPGYLTPIIEPTFGTTITRIADQIGLGLQGQCIRHGYSKKQPWNCDGSLMFFSYGQYPNALIDGRTYKFIRWIHYPSWGTWSNTNPNIIYGTSGVLTQNYKGVTYGLNSFVSCDVTTDNWTLIRRFTQYDTITIGNGEGNLSNDGRYVALICKSGSNYSIVSFDIPNNTIIATLDLGTRCPDNCSVSQSGRYVVLDWSGNIGTEWYQGLQVYDLNLTNRRQVYTWTGHGDLGYDSNGNEVFVMQATYGYGEPEDSILAVRLDGGGTTRQLNRVTHPIVGSHISCRNINRPGWCYISDNGAYQSYCFEHNEAFALKLDGSETIERFVQTRTSGYNVTGYNGSPMACPNQDGTRVVFASDWYGGAGTNQVIKMVSSTSTNLYGARQTITFNRTVGSLKVIGKSKAENVGGSKNTDYSLCYSIHYTDGTYDYPPTLNFDVGTHDWQSLYDVNSFTPNQSKIVESITFYCLFQNHVGTVWFDDICLFENEGGQNLLSNAGFQTGTSVPLTSWITYQLGYQLDQIGGNIIYSYVAEKRGDNQVIRINSADMATQYGAYQTVTFNRAVGSLTISGKSKAISASGSKNSDYSIYCDLHYSDGTNLFGQTANFNIGTHDWETSTFTPTAGKTVSSLTVYAMYRYKTGTVWFDDISLTENGGSNLLANPGFQSGTSAPLSNWSFRNSGYGLDQSSQIVTMTDTGTSTQHYIGQTIDYNSVIASFTISGKSKAQSVSGSKDSNYSVYADVHYADGSTTQHSANFNAGTHDWELATLTFTPTSSKTIDYIIVYCNFKYHSGTVWFEDVRLTENDKEQNKVINAGFDTGTSTPLPDWSIWSTGCTLSGT